MEPTPNRAQQNNGGWRSVLSLERKFNRDVFWNTLSLAFIGIGGILINASIAGLRGSAALGVFNQIYALFILLSQFAVGGIHYSVLTYASLNMRDRDRCREILTSALPTAAVLAFISCMAALPLAGLAGALLNSPDVSVGLRLAVPGLFFFSLNKVLLAFLNGLRRMRAFAAFQAMRLALLLLSVAAMLILDFPSSHLAIAFTVSETVLFCMLLPYHHFKIVSIRPRAFSLKWVGAHLSFGLRGFMLGVFVEVNTRVDVLMLGLFCSDRMVGIYSFAAMIAEGLSQFPVILRRNVDPVVGDCLARNDRDRIRAYSIKIKRVVYPLMTAVALTAAAAYPLVVWLLGVGAELQGGFAVLVILMIGIVLNSGYRPFGGVIVIGGRPEMFTLLTGMVVAGNILLNALLIPLFQIRGAAVATSLTFVVEAALIVLFARRLFGIRL